jgi:hypothetical protein
MTEFFISLTQGQRREGFLTGFYPEGVASHNPG